MARRNTSPFKLILIFLGIIFLFILIGLTILYFKYKPTVDKFVFILRPSSIKTIENTKIPTNKLPNPNAFDYYMKAANQIDTKKLDAFLNDYRSKNMIEKNKMNFYLVPLPLRKQVVSINQKPFKIIREGLKHEYMYPSFAEIVGKKEWRQNIRQLSRILVYESTVYASDGDFSKAMQSRMDSIKISCQIPRGGHVRVALFGFSMEAQSEWGISKIISSIDSNTAKKDISQIEEIINSYASLSDILLEESYYVKNNIIETIKSNKTTHRYKSDPSRHRRAEDMMNRFYANSFIDFDNYFKQYILEAKIPYPTRKKLKEPETTTENYLRSYSYDDFAFEYTFEETNRKLLLLTLALRAYYLDNHKYPQKLSELCPAYLTQLPKDPFTDLKDFKYKKTSSNYIVYSIGPDFKDNNGKPFAIDLKKKKVIPDSGSKGDILLGMTD